MRNFSNCSNIASRQKQADRRHTRSIYFKLRCCKSPSLVACCGLGTRVRTRVPCLLPPTLSESARQPSRPDEIRVASTSRWVSAFGSYLLWEEKARPLELGTASATRARLRFGRKRFFSDCGLSHCAVALPLGCCTPSCWGAARAPRLLHHVRGRGRRKVLHAAPGAFVDCVLRSPLAPVRRKCLLHCRHALVRSHEHACACLHPRYLCCGCFVRVMWLAPGQGEELL
jgi:hypothetical protein